MEQNESIQIFLEQERIELTLDGYTAFLSFEIYDNSLDVRKTFVPEELRGKGIAGKLVKAAYDYAREHNYKCLGTCSYAVTWLERHPDYHGTASSDFVPQSCAVGKHQS